MRDSNPQGEGDQRLKGNIKKSYPGNPLISIITVVYNDSENIEKTINSVVCQYYQNIEYIVIDGGSNDGTVEIIKNFDDRIDYWYSETDNGLYDAMNKGVSLSNGYILMLNAGDVIAEDDTLLKVAEQLKRNDAIYFGSVWNYNDFVGYYTPHKNNDKNADWINNQIPCHNGTFIHADIHRKYLYPLEYSIGGDAYVLHQLKIVYEMIDLGITIQRLRLGGQSNSMDNFKNVYNYFIDEWKINKEFKTEKPFITSIYMGFTHFIKYLLRKILPDKLFYKFVYRKYLSNN